MLNGVAREKIALWMTTFIMNSRYSEPVLKLKASYKNVKWKYENFFTIILFQTIQLYFTKWLFAHSHSKSCIKANKNQSFKREKLTQLLDKAGVGAKFFF